MTFIRATALRAIRTVAQAALAGIPATAVGLGDIDWTVVASTSLLAGAVSVLTSVATGLPEAEA